MQRLRGVKGPTISLLVVGCLGLLILVLLNLLSGYQAEEAFKKVNAAREVRSIAVTLRASLQAAESSQRGYLLTGNEIYLAPFATAKIDAERSMAELVQQADQVDPGRQALQALAKVVGEKIAELTNSVELFRAGRQEEGIGMLSAHRGKALMDEANVFISAIVRTAEREVTAGVQHQQDSLRTLRVSTYFAVLVVFMVTASVFVIQRAFIRDLRTANEEVISLNQTLESRVDERTRELLQARDRAEMLLAEVNHRVANSLTMIGSMIGMQSRAATGDETKRLLADAQARINAVAMVHKQLYTTTNVQSVSLEDFLPKLLDQVEGSLRNQGLSANVSQEIEPLELPTDQTISLGIILTEWVTNAFKYAYPAQSGEIRVKLSQRQDGFIEVSVADDGIGRDATAVPKGTGLGTKLVSAMAANLGGKIEYLDRKPGTEARLLLPQ
jgi:two-component sensor histidine kinase